MRSTILSRTILGKKRFLASFDAFFEQGLLVVAEDGSKAVHETFDPTGGPVHHDGDSLCVAVRGMVPSKRKRSLWSSCGAVRMASCDQTSPP